jgi:hypothetical protein
MVYANFKIMESKDYEKVHGLVECYGGRVKDCQYNWSTKEMILYYEMVKANRGYFEKELSDI